MNKRKLIFIGWIVNIVLLYLSIFLPKNELIYDITFIVFIATFLVFPLLLLIWGLFTSFNEKKKAFEFFHIVPIGGLIVLELASFWKFNQALIEEAMDKWVVVFVVVIVAQLILIIALWMGKYYFRKQAFLTILSLLFHFGFLYFAIQISFEYNNLW